MSSGTPIPNKNASKPRAPVSGGRRSSFVHTSLTRGTQELFHALDVNGDGTVSSHFMINFLTKNGLERGDKRLKEFYSFLESLDAVEKDVALNVTQFHYATESCNTLIYKCVLGHLVIPDFESLREIVESIYEKILPDKGGENADYIPQLANVDPEQFGISITTVDGQHISVGDTDNTFCIQSCSKPISYLIALNEFGQEYVHHHVGTEPSGLRFNAMALKDAPTEEHEDRKIPHNPCINAGAIMSCSMVFPDLEDRSERLKKVIEYWKALSGGDDAPIGFDEATYKSESATADRNWCLGYMMRENKSWPPCFSYEGTKSLEDTLELYFSICSITSTSRAMSIMAATLANGGLNPLTGDKVCTSSSIRKVLPLMLTCGMYDYSGEWAFSVGCPAKSGVGGCVYMVIPNVCGIAIFSPRLDDIGNSHRAVQVARELVKRVKLNAFEVFSGSAIKKFNPTAYRHADKHNEIGLTLHAASEGDVGALNAQAHSGTNLFEGDYDLRTALHLAATEGQLNAVKFLVKEAKECNNLDAISAKDRWGGTPLGDAEYNGHKLCAKVLKEAGGVIGNTTHYKADNPELSKNLVSPHAPEILFAASEGDLHSLIRIFASGDDLHVGDYDHRTALHLASSNGHINVVKYLLVSSKNRAKTIINALDRFGNTAKDDALREGHKNVLDILNQFENLCPLELATETKIKSI